MTHVDKAADAQQAVGEEVENEVNEEEFEYALLNQEVDVSSNSNNATGAAIGNEGYEEITAIHMDSDQMIGVTGSEEVVDLKKKIVILPRIKFKFRLKYGQSYQMIRTQFPLRLAYCMTYNKSQSQTLKKVLLDATEEPFAHGHLYVSLSRVTDANNIRLYIKKEQTHEWGEFDPVTKQQKLIPVVKNVIYPKAILQSINRQNQY